MFTWRDRFATLAVLGAGVVYELWFTGTQLNGVSPRVIGAVVLTLGFLGCMANQQEVAVVYGVDRSKPRPPMTYVVATSTLGAAALVAGVTTLISGSEVALATLVLAMVVLWVATTVRHLLGGRQHRDEVEGRPPLARAA